MMADPSNPISAVPVPGAERCRPYSWSLSSRSAYWSRLQPAPSSNLVQVQFSIWNGSRRTQRRSFLCSIYTKRLYPTPVARGTNCLRAKTTKSGWKQSARVWLLRYAVPPKKIDQVLLDPLELLCLSFRLKHHDSPNLTPPQVANPLEDCLPLTVQERLEALENRSIGPDVQTGDHSDETPESTPKLARLEVEVRRNRAAILYLRKATFKTPEVRKMSYNGRSMESF